MEPMYGVRHGLPREAASKYCGSADFENPIREPQLSALAPFERRLEIVIKVPSPIHVGGRPARVRRPQNSHKGAWIEPWRRVSR
jgi:hypothetical protein